jgi:hypothetical protein
MWRAVKETNRLTGISVWVIEKQTKFLWWKTGGWTRNYMVGKTIFNSPIKAFTAEAALSKMAVLESGKILVQTEAVSNE